MSKVALITGGSRGIGKSICIKLAEKGFDIALNYNSNPGFANEVVSLCKEYGVNALEFKCDVSDFDECGKMVSDVKEKLGSIDVLVNNAGITSDGLLARMSEDQFDKVTSVNYKSVFNMIRHVSPLMIKQRSGRIVNITSVVGLYGNAGQFNYCASKAGIVGMTLSAAKELGKRNITVNAVAPGFVDTDMTSSLNDKLKDTIVNNVALGRVGKPEEIASVVGFLCSDEASYLSGQVIVVDGCMSI